jgi:hypothetical protein
LPQPPQPQRKVYYESGGNGSIAVDPQSQIISAPPGKYVPVFSHAGVHDGKKPLYSLEGSDLRPVWVAPDLVHAGNLSLGYAGAYLIEEKRWLNGVSWLYSHGLYDTGGGYDSIFGFGVSSYLNVMLFSEDNPMGGTNRFWMLSGGLEPGGVVRFARGRGLFKFKGQLGFGGSNRFNGENRMDYLVGGVFSLAYACNKGRYKRELVGINARGFYHEANGLGGVEVSGFFNILSLGGCRDRTIYVPHNFDIQRNIVEHP